MNQLVNCDWIEFISSGRSRDDYKCIVADPPYGNTGYRFGAYHDRTPIDEWADWIWTGLEWCLAKLDDGGLLYCYGYPEYLAHVAVRHPHDKQRWLQWYFPKGMTAATFYTRSHESILTLWNGDRPKLNIDKIRIPFRNPEKRDRSSPVNTDTGRHAKRGDIRWRRSTVGRLKLPTDVIECAVHTAGISSQEWYKNKLWTSAFYCKTHGRAFNIHDYSRGHVDCDTVRHPTVKPLRLSTTLIQSICNKGDRVYIPFAGSGSECVAAERLGVQWDATEINPDYLLLANSWLDHERQHRDNLDPSRFQLGVPTRDLLGVCDE